MPEYFSLADASQTQEQHVGPNAPAASGRLTPEIFAANEKDLEHPTCECLFGPAGSGKSFEIAKRAADDPNYCKLVATTGIAAVNLGPGVTTINSALGFYNEESAWDALESGRLRKRFVDLSDQGYKKLVIDEVSMMSAGVLTAITLGATEAADTVQQMNGKRSRQQIPTGIILTGDMLQLPPVNAPFCFTSPVWGRYERAVTKLTTMYRQSDPAFLDALQAARAGKGTTAVMKLNQCGVRFASERNDFFEGTSLVPTNDMANKINGVRYEALDGIERAYESARWGKESGEWKDISITLQLKEGAFVMVLANEPRTFGYVNGDQGVILEMGDSYVTVQIERGSEPNKTITVKDIPFVLREVTQKAKPDEADEFTGFDLGGPFRIGSPKEIEEAHKGAVRAARDQTNADLIIESLDRLKSKRFAQFFENYDAYVADMVKRHLPYWSVDKQRWVIGWIEYMPIRLAYASTTHKAQGLTLDKVQIDARNRFAGNPGMQYVALSRCRTPGNIRIVASIGDYARRIQTAVECLRWV